MGTKNRFRFMLGEANRLYNAVDEESLRNAQVAALIAIAEGLREVVEVLDCLTSSVEDLRRTVQ